MLFARGDGRGTSPPPPPLQLRQQSGNRGDEIGPGRQQHAEIEAGHGALLSRARLEATPTAGELAAGKTAWIKMGFIGHVQRLGSDGDDECQHPQPFAASELNGCQRFHKTLLRLRPRPSRPCAEGFAP